MKSKKSCAENDRYITKQGTPIEIKDLLENDNKFDGEVWFIESYTTPEHGSIAELTDGSVLYDPEDSFTGEDSFTYVANDSVGGTHIGLVTVVVQPMGVGPNEAPSAVDDILRVPIETTLRFGIMDIISNDFDPDGDNLSVQECTEPEFGFFEILEDTFRYTPATGFVGEDSVTCTITDNNGGVDTSVITFLVGDVVQATFTKDDIYTIGRGTALSVTSPGILGNDEGFGDGSLTLEFCTDPRRGELVYESDGSITYTPNTLFIGIETIDCTILDGNGNFDTSRIMIFVVFPGTDGADGLDIPDEPEDPTITFDDGFAKHDTYGVLKDTKLTITSPGILENDEGFGDGMLSLLSCEDPKHGSLTFSSDGSLMYVPDLFYVGLDQSLCAVINGAGEIDTSTIFFHVLSPADTSLSTGEDSPLTFGPPAVIDILVLRDNISPDDDTIVSNCENAQHGMIVKNSDGTYTYTPSPDFFGVDTIQCTVGTPDTTLQTAILTIIVRPLSDEPTPVSNAIEVTMGTPFVIDPALNHPELNSGTLVVYFFSQPQNGVIVDNGDGTFTYTPNAGWSGADTFEYTISDGNGGLRSTTLSFIILGSPDASSNAEDDSYTTTTNTQLSISAPNGILINDIPSVVGVTAYTPPLNGNLIMFRDGSFDYLPNNNFVGVDVFNYVMNDGLGGAGTATVTIVVTALNSPPVAADDTYTTFSNTPITFDARVNDKDADNDELNIIQLTAPSNGDATLSGNGMITYIPRTGWTGVDSFTYFVTDGNGGEGSATISILVEAAPNSPPTAVDDQYSTSVGSTISFNAISNDRDNDGDVLLPSSFGLPSHGTISLNADGNFVYEPEDNWTGTDSFVYVVTDGKGGEDSATVTIQVIPRANSGPVAVFDVFSTVANTAISFDVLENDSDSDGHTLTISRFTQPERGTVSRQGNILTYTPPSNFNGETSFTYFISDGFGGESSATVTIMVERAPNNPPIAVDDNYVTEENLAFTFDVRVNDIDFDDNALFVLDYTESKHGELSLNSDGTFTFVPMENWNGLDTFSYEISDRFGGSDTAEVNILVQPGPNSKPIARDDTFSTDANTPVTFNVLRNDVDLDGDTLFITEFTLTQHGTLTSEDKGTFTYLPVAGWSGLDSFTYAITDANGGEDRADVSITVSKAPEVEVVTMLEAVNDLYHTQFNQPLVIADPGVLANDIFAKQVVEFTKPNKGTLSLNPQGGFMYIPETDFQGAVSSEYTVDDAMGNTDTATLVIRVFPPLQLITFNSTKGRSSDCVGAFFSNCTGVLSIKDDLLVLQEQGKRN